MKISKFVIGLSVVLLGTVGAFASSKVNFRTTYWYNTPTQTDKCQSISYSFSCTQSGTTCVGDGGAADGLSLYSSDGATNSDPCVNQLRAN